MLFKLQLHVHEQCAITCCFDATVTFFLSCFFMMHTSFPSIFISHANLKHSLYRLTTYKHSAILTCIICYCVLAPVCISIFLRQLVFNLCQLTLQFFFLFFIYISTTNLLLYLLFFLFQLLYLSINRICICCTFFRLIISICRF